MPVCVCTPRRVEPPADTDALTWPGAFAELAADADPRADAETCADAVVVARAPTLPDPPPDTDALTWPGAFAELPADADPPAEAETCTVTAAVWEAATLAFPLPLPFPPANAGAAKLARTADATSATVAAKRLIISIRAPLRLVVSTYTCLI